MKNDTIVVKSIFGIIEDFSSNDFNNSTLVLSNLESLKMFKFFDLSYFSSVNTFFIAYLIKSKL